MRACVRESVYPHACTFAEVRVVNHTDAQCTRRAHTFHMHTMVPVDAYKHSHLHRHGHIHR